MKRIAAAFAALGAVMHGGVADAAEAADVAVLRNTVANILGALVQKGLISQQAAEQLVAEARTKAAADAAAGAAADTVAPGDVRVTYVPDIVKQEISEQVAADIGSKVTEDVVARARADGWGVPGALPDWVRRAEWSGDLRLRVAPVVLSNGNAVNFYRDFQAINEAGGEAKAGSDALLNTTDDDVRYAARLRFGVETRLSELATVGFRLATGDRDNPVSSNVGLDNYSTGFEVRVDEAYLRIGGSLRADSQSVALWGGRMKVPFEHSELIWDPDLRFNGMALQYAWNAGDGPRGLFGSAGIFPLDDADFSSKDNWLAAGQAGYEWGWDQARITVAGAYYDYQNETGKRNAPGSTKYDYTAPDFVQKGNTLFDISDPTDVDSDLYALAAQYEIVDLFGRVSVELQRGLRLDVVGNFVKNVGYDEQDVFGRTGGAVVPEKADGYRFEVRLGHPKIDDLGDWSAALAYTHLERDAVVDAFTDSDFHGGGTDAEGYILGGEFGLTTNTWLRLRYLSADEVDGPPLAVDTILIDLNAAF